MLKPSMSAVKGIKGSALIIRARILTMLSILMIAGCGGGGGGSAPVTTTESSTAPLDEELDSLVKTTLSLNGNPASSRGLSQILPAENDMVKLGEILFFSQTLAAGYDVSCGTCHHPDFAGGDGLSIPVGVIPTNSAAVGPGREVDSLRDLDSKADGGPNMHRHSITTLNAALMDRVLLYDGRVRVDEADLNITPGGHGQAIRTNESAPNFDSDNTSGLLEFQSKGPIVTNNEMRGFAYTEFSTGALYREHLVKRIRGEVDTQYNTNPQAASNWLALFQAAFNMPTANATQLITMPNIQEALGVYIESQIFIDNNWKSYLQGNLTAINSNAKRGALLFYKDIADDGLGCANCHSGDRLTDENFYNVGFPQLGRGFGRTDTSDFGRWLTTRFDEDMNAFRAITLLNIEKTGPYGHAGSFNSLEDTIRYHADPRNEVNIFDFSLTQLPQFLSAGVSYADAESHTRAAIAQPSFDTAEAMLPARTLLDSEVLQLLAFFSTLTDVCVADLACLNQWAPLASEDPDGHLLVRDASLAPPANLSIETAGDYIQELSLVFPALPVLPTFADVQGCTDNLAVPNTGQNNFTQISSLNSGLTDIHGYDPITWFAGQQTEDIALSAGGVSSAYLDADCWPDLIFTGGEVSGMRFYRNNNGTSFQAIDPLLTGIPEKEFTGSAIADLNGDYRREIFFGNIKPGEIPIYSLNGIGQYDKVAAIPMTRPTFGISFAPLDSSGFPYFYLAHWSKGVGINGASPALWRNEGNKIRPWDVQAQTNSAFISQASNFTPKFADFTDDGKIDLVIASDFLTSETLRNASPTSTGPVFENDTDRTIITDGNGMGSTLLDIDNDGNLEWFVTSIAAPFSSDPNSIGGNNGGGSGNRLYRNVSTAQRIAFEDITDQAGVREGYWGWGACAADFNNDGFVDIYHVNGFGYIPNNVLINETAVSIQTQLNAKTIPLFQDKPGNLFINNGDGSFDDDADSWSIAVPSEGRGLSCFDYDRDGDIDIVVFDHSKTLQFFENNSGNGAGKKFLNVRLVGATPNTDALGAKVFVTANVGNGFGDQTQLRLSEANSNFNSQNIPDLHFGLGSAAIVDEIRVQWLDGSTLSCTNVGVNQFVVLDERTGIATCPP